jgi:hypothetical protein
LLIPIFLVLRGFVLEKEKRPLDTERELKPKDRVLAVWKTTNDGFKDWRECEVHIYLPSIIFVTRETSHESACSIVSCINYLRDPQSACSIASCINDLRDS